MLNKEKMYLRDQHLLQRHPLLQPKMRAILLDWLMEVSAAGRRGLCAPSPWLRPPGAVRRRGWHCPQFVVEAVCLSGSLTPAWSLHPTFQSSASCEGELGHL